MNCKICNKPMRQGDHTKCGEAMERTRIRPANEFIPPEIDDGYEDMRDIDIYVPAED